MPRIKKAVDYIKELSSGSNMEKRLPGKNLTANITNGQKPLSYKIF